MHWVLSYGNVMQMYDLIKNGMEMELLCSDR